MHQPFTKSALRVLATFSRSAGIAFDRIVAERALAEIERAISGNDPLVWASRMVEVGESVNLRIRTVSCSLREALAFVRQGVPIAICLDASAVEDAYTENSPLSRLSA